MSSATPKSFKKRKAGSGGSTPSGSNTPTGPTGEKKNRPKPRARQKAKEAKAKQEQEDALLAASNFAGTKDGDDVPMSDDEDGDEVELMDTDGLTAGTTDIDEDMVEAQIAAASRQSSLAPATPSAPTPSSSALKSIPHTLPTKPIASLPAHDRRTVSPSPPPEPTPSADGESSLFFVDIAPKAPKRTRQWVDPVVEAEAAALAAAAQTTEDGEVAEEKYSLLLPSHVVIERPASVGGDQQPAGEGFLTEAEVFAGELGAIEFLDGVDDRPASRYFDAQPEDGAAVGSGGKASMVCNICKQRGHVQRECSMQICLTCGAVDEHATRSCPVALVCFACGGRGHRSRECTAPRSQQRHRGNGPMCDRCGSDVHPANNCPTLWRIYLYLTPPNREDTLAERQRLKELGGFEGDVLEADPETEWGDGDGGWGGWCYNCSSEGHWGDDCPEPRTTRSGLQDFSAFSSYNAHNSPFFASQPSGEYPSSTSSSVRRPPTSRRARVQREGGMAAPMRDLVVPSQVADVGKRGKERERERARKYESANHRDDDEGSWFDKARGGGGDSGRDRNRSSKGKDRERDRDRDRGRYERDERDGGSGAGRKAGSRRDRDARTEDEKKVDAYFSGGSGTDLEREFRETGRTGGFSIKGRAQGDHDPKDRGGSSSRAPGGSRSSTKPSQPAKPGFSFKFNSPLAAPSSDRRDDDGPSTNHGGSNTPISAIRPSLLSRMEGGGSGPSSPSSSSRGSPASYDRSSSFERGGGDGDRSRSDRESDRRMKQSRSDRRDGERKDRDRKQEDAAMRERRSGGGDWLDSPDRREKTGGGGGRYRGGYR